MPSTHINHTHLSVAIELRCLGIPTTWTARADKLGGRWLVPMVSQNVERRLARITDPDEIRKRFFKLKHDEDSAREFLNEVGVWAAAEGRHNITSEGVPMKEVQLMGSFGHRWFSGFARPIELEELWSLQEHWRTLLRNPAKLRKEYGPPPSADSRPADRDTFALQSRWGNTLPVHLEWGGKHPRGVIQPITGEELLKALAWLDIVTEAKFKVCFKCGIEYTRGGRKFCTWQCEHANTVQNWRKKQKKKRTRKSLR